jgi:hypothetical protein
MSTEIKNISENNIASPINIISLTKILEIGQKNVCKMKYGEKKGTGFFCDIIIDDWNISKVRALITNGHLINKEDIKP